LTNDDDEAGACVMMQAPLGIAGRPTVTASAHGSQGTLRSSDMLSQTITPPPTDMQSLSTYS